MAEAAYKFCPTTTRTVRPKVRTSRVNADEVGRRARKGRDDGNVDVRGKGKRGGITNLLSRRERTRLNSVGKYISRAKNGSFARRRNEPSFPPRRFSIRRPHHFPAVHGPLLPCQPSSLVDYDYMATAMPTPASSYRSIASSRHGSIVRAIFTVQRRRMPPCDDGSPSSTANFNSFRLNGTRPMLPQPARCG